MEGAAGRILGDLFAAAEAVRDEDVAGCSGSDSREQDALGQSLGDGEFLFLEAEGSGHATASGVEEGDAGSGAFENLYLGLHLGQRLLVAVAVQDDRAASERGRLVVRGVAEEEIAEQEGLLAQAQCPGVVREEIAEFIAEDAGAGGFEKDDGQAGVDFGGEAVCDAFEDAFEVGAGFGEKSEIVKRAAAADVALRDLNVEAGAGEDIVRGGEGLRVEIVVPGVWPEEDGRPDLRGWSRSLAALETARGKAGQRALRRDAEERPGNVTQPGHAKGKIGEMRGDAG